MKLKLHWQILIAMALGVVIGIVFQLFYKGAQPDIWIFDIIVGMGKIWISMLKMVIIPLILSSIVSGVASVGEGKSIGRLGAKTFAYYLVSTVLAIFIGIFLTNLLKPGANADIVNKLRQTEQIQQTETQSEVPAPKESRISKTSAQKNLISPDNKIKKSPFDEKKMRKPQKPGEIIIGIVPTNLVKAAVNDHILGIIFFAIFLGFAITKIKSENQKLLKSFFNSVFDVMMKITEYIIKLAPLGVLGLITKTVATAGIGLFGTLALYTATIIGGFLIHLFLVLPGIFYFTTRINPLYHFKAMTSAMITAFSTCSSNATLPVTMRDVEKKAGVSNKISSFVLPMGATVNMNGTALYECAGVIFISQVLGIQLTLFQQFIIALTALLSAIGAAGIPAAGVVVIFIVTKAVGFTGPEVDLIIGTMLAIDRPIDMFRTTVNIFSDSMGAVIVAKSEGEKNLYAEIKKEN